jgi:hypothetical protein
LSADSKARFWSTDTLAVLVALLAALLVRAGILQKVPW